MLVFISGMPRSGSTFSHNVVRMALERRAKSVVSVTTEDSAPIFAQTADHIIAKAHGADDHLLALVRCGAVKSVCTVRRPEDAVLSWMHVFGFSLDEAIQAFSRWFSMFERISAHSLVVTLDEIERFPLLTAYRIGRHVCPDYTLVEAYQTARAMSKKRVKKIADAVENGDRQAIDIGFSRYDNTTFFHRRHISDRSQFDRRPEVTEAVRQHLGPWLNELGDVHCRYLRRSLTRRAFDRLARKYRGFVPVPVPSALTNSQVPRTRL